MTTNSLELGGDFQPTSVKFTTAGTTVTGKITEIEANIQQTDYTTGELLWWDKAETRPQLMHRVNLQTSHRNGELLDPEKWGNYSGEDSGERTIYLRGSTKEASKSIMAAVSFAAKAAGVTSIAVGGELTVTYVGDGARTNPKFNPPKQFEASYKVPSLDVSSEAEAAPAVAAPVAPAAASVAQPAQVDPQAAAAALAALTPEQKAALGL